MKVFNRREASPQVFDESYIYAKMRWITPRVEWWLSYNVDKGGSNGRCERNYWIMWARGGCLWYSN